MRCCCGDHCLFGAVVETLVYAVLLWRPLFVRCCSGDLSLCGAVVETLVYAVLLWRL